MAKRHVFPENQSLHARMECLIAGFSECRAVLQNIHQFALDKLPENLQKAIRQHVESALASADLASRALCGDE